MDGGCCGLAEVMSRLGAGLDRGDAGTAARADASAGNDGKTKGKEIQRFGGKQVVENVDPVAKRGGAQES